MFFVGSGIEGKRRERRRQKLIQGAVCSVLLSQSLAASASYDAAAVKQLIGEKQSLFQVTQWHGDDAQKSWHVSSSIKYLSVEINPSKAVIGSAYFNPATRASARERCMALASLALAPLTDEDIKAIDAVLAKATQHHATHSIELNNVRFEAFPKLQTVFVSLYCSVSNTGDAAS